MATGFQSFTQNSKTLFPFAAIVGLTDAKRALMLLAVDRKLKGVLIGARSGSAKSLLARSIQSILPDAPFIEVPLNVTEERLLGGIDLERTIAAGRRALASGLLAEADGGILCVDDVNLFDANTACQIGVALDYGAFRVEREGLSARHNSRFVLVGSFNPMEGEAASSLRDRVGFIIELEPEKDSQSVPEIISRALSFDCDAESFSSEYLQETSAIRELIENARLRLPEVRINKEDNLRIAQAAMSLGVEGNRADIFAAHAARANAALEGRKRVVDEDLVVAIRLVLLSRATRIPDLDKAKEDHAEIESIEQRRNDERREADDAGEAENQRAAEELIIEALASPAVAIDPMRAESRRFKESGRRANNSYSMRGRYRRSVIERRAKRKIAIDATLRAAAPFQPARKSGKAGQSVSSPNRVRIKPDDLRFKRFKQRSGVLFIFAVDASGSMAVNRMAQAKGALTRLLQQAYIHRDKVALISFRHKEARVVLPPTRSVELAKRLVDAMPAGGATPLAAGLIESLKVARMARSRSLPEAMVVIFTDGRANVRLAAEVSNENATQSGAIREELRLVGAMLDAEGIASMVVDTKSRFVSNGEARSLADLIGSRYVYLPLADAETVYKVISDAAVGIRPVNRA